MRTAGAGADLLLYVHCDAGMRAARALRRGLADGKLESRAGLRPRWTGYSRSVPLCERLHAW